MSNGADPRTPHLDLVLPIVGDEAGEDLWGDKTNANWAKVDDNAAQVADDLNTIFEQALPDAPADSVLYGRLDQTWSPVPTYDNPDWTEVQNKPETFPPAEHDHPISEVITLQAELDAKEPTIAAGTAADFWRGDKTWQLIASVAGIGEAPADGQTYARHGATASWHVVAMDWNALAGKPATFPPSAHNHPISQVTNLQVALDSKEPVIAAGTAAQFWRGDKTWQPFSALTVDAYTRAQSDARFEPIDSAYTKVEGDARYERTITAGTTSQFWRGDKTWQPLSSITVDAYTKAQSDAKYEPLDSAYTKAESDGRYEPFDSAYTKAEGDAKYEPKIATGNPSLYWAGDKTWKAVAVSAGVTIAEAPPPTPANGQLWWEADTGRMFIWVVDATGPGQWVETSGGSGVPTVITADTAPPFKLNGLWYNTATGILSFGYRDANTDQWVAIVGGGTIAGAGAYLPLVGGVLTGPLRMNDDTPWIDLSKTSGTAGTQVAGVGGMVNGNYRWWMSLGNENPESIGNAGSNFTIERYDDAGLWLGVPFKIARADGSVWLDKPTAASNQKLVFSTGGLEAWHWHHYLDGNLYLGRHNPPGTFADNAIRIEVANGIATFTSNINANMFVTKNGVNGGYICKNASGGNALGVNWFNFFWNGTMHGYVDNTYLGAVSWLSDYRIKKDVVDLGSTWEQIRALRPIQYTHADYTPPAEAERADTRDGAAFFVGDEIVRWGFVAHELQETLIESAASGVKDQDDCIQSPNPWTIIAALTKTVQELQARVEALEAP